MGFENRDWYKQDGGVGAPDGPWRRAAGRGRFFTVNSWIILICVGIFVLDGFLPTRYVPLGTRHLLPEFQSIPDGRLRVGDVNLPHRETLVDPRTRRPVERITVFRDLFDPTTGQKVGVIEMRPMRWLESFLYFSTAELIYGAGYWRLVGFQFLHDHSSILHLTLNMMGLFFFGPIVERRLGGKRYLAFYLLCGIFGALTYLLLNLMGYVAVEHLGWAGARVPFLLVNDPRTPLIGASAGVYGVLMAGAYLVPHAIVYVFFVLPMRFDRVAYLMVLISVVSLAFSTGNAGGEAAHLGGALAGAYFIRRQHHLHGFFDFLGRVDPTSRSARVRRMSRRGGDGGGGRAGPGRAQGAMARGAEIDRILQKIADQGMGSLTDSERQTLRSASGRS